MEGWKMKEFPGAQMSYVACCRKKEFVVIEPISLSGHISLIIKEDIKWLQNYQK